MKIMSLRSVIAQSKDVTLKANLILGQIRYLLSRLEIIAKIMVLLLRISLAVLDKAINQIDSQFKEIDRELSKFISQDSFERPRPWPPFLGFRPNPYKWVESYYCLSKWRFD